jgi:hypothetical protein
MSGSGGGSGRFTFGGTGGTGGEGEPSQDCGSLVVETTLNSPVANVVSSLKKGERLTVAVQVSASGVNSLIAKKSSGEIAGSLTPPSLITILNCIQDGFQYVAIILNEPSGGIVRVRVQAAT